MLNRLVIRLPTAAMISVDALRVTLGPIALGALGLIKRELSLHYAAYCRVANGRHWLTRIRSYREPCSRFEAANRSGECHWQDLGSRRIDLRECNHQCRASMPCLDAVFHTNATIGNSPCIACARQNTFHLIIVG